MSRKIALFVEGHTERQSLSAFFHKWLDPQLPENGKVGIVLVRFEGNSNYLQDLTQKVELYLDKNRAHVIFGLIDLYGLPPDRVNLSDCHTVAEKVKKARLIIRNLIPQKFQRRFRQHFAVHEVEAWLLAYPEKWPNEIRSKITRKSPEEINFDQPPAKLLASLLKKKYKKTVRAKNIFSFVDPAIAYEKCPHLKCLLDDLLRVAKRLQ